MVNPIKVLITAIVCAVALLIVTELLIAQMTEPSALQLEAKVPLGDVQGRIDHMAIDLARQQEYPC